jgi:hypothetical protein
MASKKITVSEAGQATVTDAVVGDILTTALSTDSALTGTYGLFQKGLLVVLGMSIQSKRLTGNFNPI